MKHSKFSKYVFAMILALTIVMPTAGAAQEAGNGGAKAMFYDPAAKRIWPSKEKPPAPKTRKRPSARRPVTALPPSESASVKHPGIHYWIEQEGKGAVTEETTFYTGDRIRLYVRSNVDGYLSLWARDESGKSQRLFPPVEQPEFNNLVQAGTEYTTPGWITFRPPAEDERMVIFFSRSRSEVPMGQNGWIGAEEGKQHSPSQGSKAMSFELEKDDPSSVGGYVVSLDGGSVTRQVRLKHQARKESQ